jgi:broad specificity phosphatase PhoE
MESDVSDWSVDPAHAVDRDLLDQQLVFIEEVFVELIAEVIVRVVGDQRLSVLFEHVDRGHEHTLAAGPNKNSHGYSPCVAILRFVTHPQVRISADVPVPLWGLSETGRARAVRFAEQPWVRHITRIVSSAETKALETAAILALAITVPIEVRHALHENDRSATGFVPPDRFEVLADAFFASPDASVEGWETSSDAQRRVVDATADLLMRTPSKPGDIAVIGHGAVGTLLLCHLLEVPIIRALDQVGGDAAPGGGNFWSFDLADRRVLHSWRPIDAS